MHIKSVYSDYVGIFSAFLCLIHCLVGPLVLGAASHAHEHAHEGSIFLHPYWDFVFLTIGFVAVWFSSKHMTALSKKILLWLSFAFLAGSIFFEEYAEGLHYAVYAASVFLIIAHSSNIWEMFKRKEFKA